MKNITKFRAPRTPNGIVSIMRAVRSVYGEGVCRVLVSRPKGSELSGGCGDGGKL